MIKSMTGYGKAEAILKGGKLTVEIRSLNSKSADISLKTPLLPRDKELAIRQRLADTLHRGTIDMFLTWEPNAQEEAKKINQSLAQEYAAQFKELAAGIGCPDPTLDSAASAILMSSIVRLPDVVDTVRQSIITEENWPAVDAAINEALAKICEYRSTEGKALYADVTSRVQNILALYDEVEGYEAERMQAVRERIQKAAQDLFISMDPDRFEQEMIFYLEKLDINEEKVRLRQHCKYFLETIDTDEYPGKKLGFIIQEMGREINTTGSKANYSPIQKCVVRMKDELEKIREQSMNIL